MTREEFVKETLDRLAMPSEEELKKWGYLIGVCKCGAKDCKGWKVLT